LNVECAAPAQLTDRWIDHGRAVRSSWMGKGAGRRPRGLRARKVSPRRRGVCVASFERPTNLASLSDDISPSARKNWSRPATKSADLPVRPCFGGVHRNDLATLHRDGVRVRVIGPPQTRDGIGAGHLRASEKKGKAEDSARGMDTEA